MIQHMKNAKEDDGKKGENIKGAEGNEKEEEEETEEDDDDAKKEIWEKRKRKSLIRISVLMNATAATDKETDCAM